MRKLALHQITAMEASPAELVTIASDVGCAQVCLFVHSPLVPVPGSERLQHLFPTVTSDNAGEVRARLDQTGVTIMNIEYFPIAEDVDFAAYRQPMALGASLGAERIVTHVHDTDRLRACRRLDDLCAMADDHGLKVGLEFMGLSPGCNSILVAHELVKAVGRPNLGIAIDALHLARTGGTVAQVAAIPAAHIAYAQLCDGPDTGTSDAYLPEAMDRMMPGTGAFPLRDLVAALPADTPIDIEVPGKTLHAAGVDAGTRARQAIAASRALFA